MSAKEIKTLVHRWLEESNKGKAAAMAVIDKLCASDCILHGGSGRDYSVEEYKKSMSELFSAFPDLHQTIDDILAEGDKVAVRLTFSCTHKGEFMGIPPTNKKVTMWEIQIYRIAGGKFAEIWARYDTLGLMQQLGHVPTQKKGRK